MTSLRDVRVLLFALLDNYSPAWYYQMGKAGYECSFCQEVIKESGSFNRPELHAEDCPYIAAVALRGNGIAEMAEDEDLRVKLAAALTEVAETEAEAERLANEGVVYEVTIADLRAKLAVVEAKIAELEAIIARIDAITPPADSTCNEPGITLSEAVWRQLQDEA